MRSILEHIPIPLGSKGLYKKGKIEKGFESEVFTFLRKRDYLCYHPIYTNYAYIGNGEIFSIHTGKIISPGDNGLGYKIFFAYPGCKRYYVHRFILECFHGIKNEMECNHINSDRSDNRIENLEYCTRKENMVHASKTGNFITNFNTRHPDKGKFGSDNRKSKKVYQYDLSSGKFIQSFGGGLEAKRITGVDNSDIGQCCLGKLKSAGGFIWSRTYYEKYPI